MNWRYKVHKAYYGDAGAQIHYRAAGEGEALVLLAPSPHSGLYFETVMPHLAGDFQAFAPDYPGYGGSDALPGKASIEGYARSLEPFIRSLGGAYLAGFHTGNLVALELGLICPNLVKSTIMIDVPFFEAAKRGELNVKMGQTAKLPSNISDLGATFEANITKRIQGLGHQRAYDIWTESLRAGTGRNAAFGAAFAYDCEAKLSVLELPVHLIATQSGLLDLTRKAADVLPNANLAERLDIEGSVFDKYAARTAQEIIRAARL